MTDEVINNMKPLALKKLCKQLVFEREIMWKRMRQCQHEESEAKASVRVLEEELALLHVMEDNLTQHREKRDKDRKEFPGQPFKCDNVPVIEELQNDQRK